MVVAGILLTLAQTVQSLPDHSFAPSFAGWSRATYGAEPNVVVDRKTGHGTVASIGVSATEPSDTAFATDVKVAPGHFYYLSGWVKTEDLDPKGSPVYGTIQVQSPGGHILASGHNHSGTTPWTFESVSFMAPANGTVHLAAFFCGWGKGIGSAWFSDIRLEPIDTSRATIKFTNTPLVNARISPLQYGQFIEYLCDLVPSMWAEKLYDGSFEGLSPYKFKFTTETDFKENPWYPYGQVTRLKVSQDTSTKISGSASKLIQLGEGAPSTAGIAQDGVVVEQDAECRFSIWVKGSRPKGTMTVRLLNGTQTLATASLTTDQHWQKVHCNLVPNATANNATFTITFNGPGTYWLDNASLMPSDTVGGWRKDVYWALRNLRPGTIRVGGSVLDDANLGTFEWKDTIGNPDFRVPFRAWGGLQPTGPGLEEIVQLIRSVKAEPLICLRYEKKTPKDAADEVEYFNGSIYTPMGALRAKNGHPAPYKLKYWQIGNERWGEEYWKAVPEFAKAILKVDPSVKLLTSFPSDKLISQAAPYINYVSPHQYDVADLDGSRRELSETREMIRKNANGKALKVAVTEWNTTAGDAGLPRAMLWDLNNALACSRYHNLLHRQADLVEIANRSNLTNSFCSGIIQTSRSGLYLTPTYWAQSLYSNLAGSRPMKVESNLPIDLAPDISSTLSADGKDLTVFFVNQSLSEQKRNLDFSQLNGQSQSLMVWTLADRNRAGEPDATNSFQDPTRIEPNGGMVQAEAGRLTYTFPALSLTVIRCRLK